MITQEEEFEMRRKIAAQEKVIAGRDRQMSAMTEAIDNSHRSHHFYEI